MLLTVIVPVYNTENYVGRCIDSILNQSVGNLEIILINDGSRDSSGDICNNYRRQDSRVKVIHQENQGVSVARNTGLDLAEGKYVLFVDSDDVLPENALESLINANIGDEYGLVIGDCKVIGNNQKFSYLTVIECEYSNILLCIEMMIVPRTKLLMSAVWAKLFRNDIIRNHKIRFSSVLINGEDGMFVLDYISHVERIRHIRSNVYTLYRYDEADRISAVSPFYYDFYDFYLNHSRKLWNIAETGITKELERSFYSKFIDGMIIYLVHATAYEDYLPHKSAFPILYSIVNDELVKIAMKSYKRDDPTFSIMIPMFMRLRNDRLLYLALKIRVYLYWKNHTRAKLVKSIYKI